MNRANYFYFQYRQVALYFSFKPFLMPHVLESKYHNYKFAQHVIYMHSNIFRLTVNRRTRILILVDPKKYIIYRTAYKTGLHTDLRQF